MIELYSWVTLDLKSLYIVGCCIDLSNDKVIDVFNFLSKIIPDRSKSFAVAAPWCVVLNKHILFRIIHYTVKCLSDYGSEAVNDLRIRHIL